MNITQLLLSIRWKSFLWTLFTYLVLGVLGFFTSETFRVLLEEFQIPAIVFTVSTLVVPQIVAYLRDLWVLKQAAKRQGVRYTSQLRDSDIPTLI